MGGWVEGGQYDEVKGVGGGFRFLVESLVNQRFSHRSPAEYTTV